MSTINNLALEQGYVYSSLAVQEVVGSNPGRTTTQGLEITEEKVLPL